MTGKHGGHAWVRNNVEVKPEGQTPLPESEVTLAERFKQAGYATAAMGKWGLGPPGSTGDPLKQGVDHFFGYNCQRHAHNHYPEWVYRDAQRFKLEGNTGGPNGRQYTQDLFESEAMAFIDAHRDRPFFLYLPFIVPHVAIQVPDDSLNEYRGKWDDPAYDGKKGYLPHPAPRAGYAAMVTRMDRSVGRILDQLKKLKIDDQTLVVFTSDNGPTHDGVGGSDSVFFKSAGSLRGLKGSVYEGGLRVPLIARWPGRIKAGTVSDFPSYFPDLFPTLMASIGEKPPSDIDGTSLAPTLLGKPDQQRRPRFLYWEFHGYGGQQAVRFGDWKAVRRNLHKGKVVTELYNLAVDPGESMDVASDNPKVVREAEGYMQGAHLPSKLFPLKAIGD
jgi:arylsulfatase